MNANLKVYKDIICLEVPTPHGPKWWWQSGNLAYTPCHISLIQEVKQATVSNKGNMLTVPVRIDGRTVLVAINVARSDIAALENYNRIPRGSVRYTPPQQYTPWPEYTQNSPARIVPA